MFAIEKLRKTTENHVLYLQFILNLKYSKHKKVFFLDENSNEIPMEMSQEMIKLASGIELIALA